jgi:REP element-mobilizing transposase RayT
MENRHGSHSVYSLQVHLVWITKYRYQVLQGEIQHRCREIIRQSCNSLDIQIIKDVASKDHIHLHISYSPRLNIKRNSKTLKGSKFPFVDAGISGASSPLLRQSFLKNWLWQLECRYYHGRNTVQLPESPQRTAQWR